MKNTREEKKSRRAQLHMKVLRARMNKTPLIMAWAISLYTAIFAGIVSGSGAVGFGWFVCMMIFAQVPFWIIGGVTRSAYRWYKDRIRYEEQQEKSRNSQKQSDSQKQSNSQSGSEQRSGSQHKESDSGSQHTGSHSGSSRGNSKVEEAMRLFGLQGSFTAEELKRAWRRELKKCHPDQNVNSANAKADEDRTKRINLAYDLLRGMAVN